MKNLTGWQPIETAPRDGTPDGPETTGTPDNKEDKPKMVSAGRVEMINSDGEKVRMNMALVILFDNAESLRAALVSGNVSFETF